MQWKHRKEVTDWKYWHPMSVIQNGCPGFQEDVAYNVLFDGFGSAMVEEKRHVHGLFTEKLELYDYPFDTQVTIH